MINNYFFLQFANSKFKILSPPLAQACSLCPIQNSLTRPTRLTCLTRLTCPICLTRLTCLTRPTCLTIAGAARTPSLPNPPNPPSLPKFANSQIC